MIVLKADIDKAVAAIKSLQEEQLPYITARSLTAVAQEGQKAARVLEGQVFKLRNDWTTQSTRIEPATKNNLLSTIFTDTSNRKTGAPDYLPGQQSGYEKVPHNGRPHLAIPTQYLRRVAPQIIPDGLRPKNLLPPNAEVGKAYAGRFSRGVAPRRWIGAAPKRRLGSDEFVAFIQKVRSTGTLCIFVRRGTKDAEPWYLLVAEATVAPRFPMEQVVQDVIDSEFEEIFVTVAKDVGISLDGGDL